MSKKLHKNVELRIKNVCALAQLHYEAGNQSKCYKAVWRHYIYPVYPMCYRTFLIYINTKLSATTCDSPHHPTLF